MKQLSIKDTLFSHAYSTSNWYKPTNFEWNFKDIVNDFVFLTDDWLFKHNEFCNLKKYAWVVESPAIRPESNRYVLENGNVYDKIFTHNKEILDKYAHAYLMPIGGCHLDENEIDLYIGQKFKKVSLMLSAKRTTSGHILRHKIVEALGSKNLFDALGSGKGGAHVKKILSCKDYMFSIVIENCKQDYYFSEKIVDCFLSGCVPIYWGCPSISKFFNINGFLTFDTIEELEAILTSDLTSFYNSHSSEIAENFEKAKEFKIGDDYLFNQYSQIL